MPEKYRWMLFVDGENLTIRVQQTDKFKELEFEKGKYWEPDVYLWVPYTDPNNDPFRYVGATFHLKIPYRLEDHAIRSYYYTALTGDEEKIRLIQSKLRDLKFDPQVFKKRYDKSKGVDISIARDLLSHAFRDNYDLAILIAGDRDYIPLVDELKRLGKVVCIYFLGDPKGGTSEELKLAADHYGNIDDSLFSTWEKYLNDKKKKEGVGFNKTSQEGK